MRFPAFLLQTMCAAAALACGCAFAGADQLPEIEPPRIESVELGFGGCFKLGHWTPANVVVVGQTGGDQETGNLVLSCSAPDCDGVPMLVSRPIRKNEQPQRVGLTSRVGRVAPLRVTLSGPEGRVDEHTVPVAMGRTDSARALAATDTLIARVGAAAAPIDGLAGTGSDQAQTVTTSVADPSRLPVDWIAYESIDLLVIESAASAAWRESPPSDTQLAALLRWVETGGRVLLSLGAEAESLIGAGGPLTDLAPGAFRRVVTLPAATALERYADAEVSLEGVLRVAQLEAVNGVIEAHGPGRPADLPLIIQTPRGLGEVVTLTFDIDSPGLAAWPGRAQLLRRLGGVDASAGVGGNSNSARLRQGNTELASTLRSRLGSSLVGVSATPFLAIVGATLLYLALIGPGDYFFVKRVLRRMSLSWVTFSLLVATACGAALGIGAAKRAVPTSLSQITLVDVDVATGVARGASWAEVYDARGSRRSLSIAPRGLDGKPISAAAGAGAERAAAKAWLGWFGQPGAGLTGMQASLGIGGDRSAYRLASRGDQLVGLPIDPASTKTLAARWSFDLPQRIEPDLTADRGGLVEGSIVNATPATLRNARLFYGDWAWRLGTLASGGVTVVDDGLAPVKLTTLLRSELSASTPGQKPRPIDVEEADAVGVLKLMMFFDRAGGRAFAERDLRYQRFVDLSHQLRAGRAVLLAEVARSDAEGARSDNNAGADIVDAATGEPIAPSAPKSPVFYRFVLPVAPAE